MTASLKSLASLRAATFVIAAVMFCWLIHYFYTGSGGARLLAVNLVPMALVLHILFALRDGGPYARLPRLANAALAAIYIAILAYAGWYLHTNFEDVAIWRQGSYNTHDFVVGLLAFLVVMELSRLAHPILFWVNVVLVVYTIWGHLVPLDFFWHPGTSFYRVVTSSTVELATGIFGLYAQLALTVIAAFLLLAAAARGFDAQGAMVHVMRRLAGRRRSMVPQTAVLASVSVGMISGSGAANTAVTGSFTIPLMRRYGVPPAFAGAVETAASMGGLVMPPLMAVAGFLMAEFLGVPYWDVVIRGFGIAFIYFASLILAVYLIGLRRIPDDRVPVPPVAAYDIAKTVIFFAAIVLLIVLMGGLGIGALRAALYTGIALFAALFANYLVFRHLLKDPEASRDSLLRAVIDGVETHAEMTSYLVLLMATLGIMIGLFTVTGFILRMGNILLQLGEFHVAATIIAAWVFGWLVGAGLPPTATYIVLAVIVVQPLRALGFDLWTAHFFCFLMAIWGELSPPTSLTAAVAARLAQASFMRTMWEALKLCIPITFLTFAIFVREDVVVNPGWPQILDLAMISIAICGITVAIFGNLFAGPLADRAVRAALGVLAFALMFWPNGIIAYLLAVVVLALAVFGVWRHNTVAPQNLRRQIEAEGGAVPAPV